MEHLKKLKNIKLKSENYWKDIELIQNIYGFQIQKGTKWLPGLTATEIAEYERIMGFVFPDVYKAYLSVINGTDKETVNIYANSGYPYQYSVGFYSFPRDINIVKERIQWIYDSCNIDDIKITKECIPHIIPVVSHRFLVIDNCKTNPILSMYGDDIVPYADDLISFLKNHIFNRAASAVKDNIDIKFWLDVAL